MSEAWRVKNIPNGQNNYKRIGYGKEYEFSYDDVIKHFDYFRGYLEKESQRVSKTQADNVYDQVLKQHNYATRVPLPSLKTEKPAQPLTWEAITSKQGWDYVPPQQLSEIQQCRKEINELDQRLDESAEIEKEALDMLEQVQLEASLSKKLLAACLEALKTAGIDIENMEDLLNAAYQEPDKFSKDLQQTIIKQVKNI